MWAANSEYRGFCKTSDCDMRSAGDEGRDKLSILAAASVALILTHKSQID